MSEDNLRERQENEVEAIKAIYCSDVEDLRTGRKGGDEASWNYEAALALDPPVITLRLLPQRGNSAGAGAGYGQNDPALTFVVLCIKIPLDYPNVIPEMSVVDSKGLSSQELNELISDLNTLAKENLGEVMIYDLAQRAESFLLDHQKRPTGSFYDEMVMRKKRIEEEKEQKELVIQEKERLALQEEIFKKQEALKEETRRRKEQWKMQVAQNGSPTNSVHSSPIKGDGFPSVMLGVNNKKKRRSISSRRIRTTSEESDSSISESSDIVNLEFYCGKTIRLFHKGEILGRSARGSTVSAGMDAVVGSLVSICEWRFVIKLDKKGREMKDIGGGETITMDGLLKQLHGFEPEFNLLQKLQHQNLVLYFGLKISQEDAGIVALYIAQEFVRGTTLLSYLQDTLTLDLALVRHCAQGILKGLEYLHANNIVHRFLRDTSIFLDTTGEVKIADYGLERKISELYNHTSGTPEIPDKFSPSIGRGAKKGDIYRFGVLILSLVKGQYVNDNPPVIPSSLPPELQDFFKKCLTTSEHSRATAEELLEHTFIKMALQKGPTMQCFRENAAVCAKTQKGEDDDDDNEEMDPPTFLSHFTSGHSRLKNEFEVLKWLGRGGFGDVLKVKNKLDGRVYALKRIRLNPKNKQLNKKITREVKLLSQLNHENVVRYFNSWIETVVDCESEETSSSFAADSPTSAKTHNKQSPLPNSIPNVRFNLNKFNNNSLGLTDNIEELAPPVKDSEWSISIVNQNLCDDSEESSDDEDLFGTSFLRGDDDESEDIIFESNNSESVSQSQTSESQNGTRKDESQSEQNRNKIANGGNKTLTEDDQELFHLRETQFMYIQMEFCEKSTLRTAIDDNLYEDQERVWRLFREIVEGLCHIHQQGMIHRDLKPVNIFLDSYDQVKIGDFGLATTNNFPKNPVGGECPPTPHTDLVGARSIDFGDESLTGHVGTAMYVAPELVSTTTAKTMYNQKVDIYSLGIIFFEMFYHPLQTSMERIRVIAGLRSSEINFPSDFDPDVYPQQGYIVKWLMNHNASQRPTSLELLQSDYLPPPQMEEAQLQEMFRHTLSNTQSKAYKYLMASCFRQRISAAEDVTYDMDNSKLQPGVGYHSRSLLIQNVKRIVRNVFERHGGLELSTPLLMPKSQLYDGSDTSANLICHSGSVVSLPYDLRVSFARFVTLNTITHMKRYSIDKVFRERKVYGFHPRELIECAFDVINSTPGSLISDAEVISIVFEILKDLPWTKDRSCMIRLNHTFLLDGLFIHHGIDEKYHDKIKSILADIKVERNSKLQIQTMLCSLCLPESFISMLFNLMELEGSHSKIASTLKGITKRKGEATSKVKEGLHELEILEEHIKAFGLKTSQCNVVVNPTMVFGTKVYSGLVFQVVCSLRRRKNKQTFEVIAAGGRYDRLIDTFHSTLAKTGLTSKDLRQCGVGISISLDKLVAGFETDEGQNFGKKSAVDVLVCSVGHTMAREKIDIMKEFWAHGIICTLLDDSQDNSASPEDFCKEVGASYIVILKEGEYPSNNIRVRSWERDRFQERKMSRQEVIELILKGRRVSLDGSSESTVNVGLLRSESSTNTKLINQAGESNSNMQSGSGNMPSVNISFVIQEKEKLANWKRRYENVMMSHIVEILPKLSKLQIVELLGMEVNTAVINTLASTLQLSDKEEYNKSVSEVIEKHPRFKKYLKNICDEIFELNFEKGAAIIIIYGLTDNYYRILL